MKVIANIDAGCRGGNPGICAIGVVLLVEDERHVATMIVGEMTNNQAEWHALLLALEIVATIAGVGEGTEIEINSDSKLVVFQALGRWRVRGHLRELEAEAQRRALDLQERGVVVLIRHIPREQNADVDRVVRDVLDAHVGRARGY